jgi:hypothetical protein
VAVSYAPQILHPNGELLQLIFTNSYQMKELHIASQGEAMMQYNNWDIRHIMRQFSQEKLRDTSYFQLNP